MCLHFPLTSGDLCDKIGEGPGEEISWLWSWIALPRQFWVEDVETFGSVGYRGSLRHVVQRVLHWGPERHCRNPDACHVGALRVLRIPGKA